MKMSDKSKQHVDSCRFCWMCHHVCPIGNATGQERCTARARAFGLSLVNREVFDLTETVREVLQRYGKLTEKDEYIISFEADENVMVSADRTMILQVIYNLINNALNYTGEDKRVTIDQSVWDNKVRISVIDTGEGIPPEDIPYIWDRYYKVDKVHRRATVGSGLGLSIVKGILEAHEASYGAESEIGKGSTFYFELEKVDPKEYDV